MRIVRTMALAGYFGLLGLWLLWSTAFAPARHAPTVLVLAMSALPLLLVLRSLLHDRRGGYVWLAFFGLVYFMHGVGAATDVTQRALAYGEISLSLLMFVGCIYRLRAKDNS